MGGYAAFAMLRHAPRYVQGLILADTRPEADTPEGVEGRRKMLELVQAKGPAAVADEMIPKLLGETTRRTRPEVVDRVRSLVLSNSADAIAGAIRALMTRPDSTPLLSTIHVPTLIRRRRRGHGDAAGARREDARRHRRLGVDGHHRGRPPEQPRAARGVQRRSRAASSPIGYSREMRSLCSYLCVFACLTLVATPAAQESLADGARRKTFDQLLDLYVRERGRLLPCAQSRTRQARRLHQPAGDDGRRQAVARRAARVLAERLQRDRAEDGHRSLPDSGQVVRDYPPKSIRQISGAFERLPHRVAGPHADARSDRADRPGRLPRSARVLRARTRGGRQWTAAQRSLRPGANRAAARRDRRGVRHARPVRPRSIARRPRSTSARSFRGARRSSPRRTPTRPRTTFASRSPIERAVIAFVLPNLLPSEKEFLAKNSFQLVYTPFDWTLNDLTGRGGR